MTSAWSFALSGLTLLVLTATAGLPALLAQPEPRARLEVAPVVSRPLLVVRSATGGWYLAGRSFTAAELARRLPLESGDGALVRFLPSSALASAEVSRSLAWLRRHTAAAVMLELPPRQP